ncbi:hypothetical protein E2562_027555 [Oryza meyeriana var. granulata]|uniref:Leucine-rich repeat-containing N-terminal plant-type domain-containing protein n=1 Tax=Oryza meyeriana var. granulata TaxID=110450 RepID=A0A6G1CI66_9ORYZ|nr:hypothetical protein E2562_027555 [Oryza meyeriana var. granulata]
MIHGQSNKEVLLELKNFLQAQNPINHGAYISWPESETLPCHWKGIGCDEAGHVNFLDLSNSNIAGPSFSGFSCLTRHKNFPEICGNLTFLSVSSNSFTGRIDKLFDNCPKLKHVDLSWNSFTGIVWPGIERLRQFKANNNNLTEKISPGIFTTGFHGSVPPGIGSIAGFEELVLASNSFDGNIPMELTNCTNLKYLDISDNNFGGEVQDVFGKLTGMRSLLLQENNYTGGITSSGIHQLPNLIVLDLCYNQFSGDLPSEISSMKNLKVLMLEENNFSGKIPPTYGQLLRLQVLDLSFNSLSGEIPPDIGNLSSLLLLMLAGNQISDGMPAPYSNWTSVQPKLLIRLKTIIEQDSTNRS